MVNGLRGEAKQVSYFLERIKIALSSDYTDIGLSPIVIWQIRNGLVYTSMSTAYLALR
jgi:hypothetical protein